MANYYKQVPRGIPAYAEALGVRSPEEMQHIILENGKLVFRPPRLEMQRKLIEEAERRAEEYRDSISDLADKAGDDSDAGQEPESRSARKREALSGTLSANQGPTQTQPVRATNQPGSATPTQNTSFNANLRIDLDEMPIWPPKLTVRRHRPGGKFYWDPTRVQLHRSPRQSGYGITGTSLKSELRTKRPFNVNLLRWLLKHTHLIPASWCQSGRKIFFWDTIYEDHNGNAVVIYLASRKLQWTVGQQRLTEIWTLNDYAVCLL